MANELLCVCPVCRRAHFQTVLRSEAEKLEPSFWYAGNVPVYSRECERCRLAQYDPRNSLYNIREERDDDE